MLLLVQRMVAAGSQVQITQTMMVCISFFLTLFVIRLSSSIDIFCGTSGSFQYPVSSDFWSGVRESVSNCISVLLLSFHFYRVVG